MADLNETPGASRVRISFFGRRNAGKSTLLNAVAGQEIAVVSPVPGTTTDPVSKAMELLPLGPVLFTDTPGLDDEGELGELRVRKTREVLERTDVAVIVTADGRNGPCEEEIARACAERGIPVVPFARGDDPERLKDRLAALAPADAPPPLLADLVAPGETVALVCPIDGSAPKGRLILPQQQVIRELLELGCVAVACQPARLRALFAEEAFARACRLVVTDSQAFAETAAATPPAVPLTGFSILFARQKGDLGQYRAGLAALGSLRDGACVLVAEGCTHRRQCGDVGTVKLPRAVRAFTGKDLSFEFCSGNDFPLDPARHALVIHCGGCMLARRAVLARLAACRRAGVPVVNYGLALAHCRGLRLRADAPLVDRGCA